MAEVAGIEFKDKKIQRFVASLTKNVKDVSEKKRKFRGLLGSIVFRDVIEHFSRQQGSDLEPWQEWSDLYTARMLKIGKGGNRILQDNGRLRQSFLPSNNRVLFDSIVWFNPGRTAKGFPYAKAHDEGGKKLPQREFMWLSGKAIKKIERITIKHILK